MAQKNLLLVGESWMSSATHYKGFDQFGSVTFHLGAEPFVGRPRVGRCGRRRRLCALLRSIHMCFAPSPRGEHDREE